MRADEAYAECIAQAEQLLDAGLTVTHLDGHLHLHLLPGVWEGVVAAAKTLGDLPIRVPRERGFLPQHRATEFQATRARDSLRARGATRYSAGRSVAIRRRHVAGRPASPRPTLGSYRDTSGWNFGAHDAPGLRQRVASGWRSLRRTPSVRAPIAHVTRAARRTRLAGRDVDGFPRARRKRGAMMRCARYSGAGAIASDDVPSGRSDRMRRRIRKSADMSVPSRATRTRRPCSCRQVDPDLLDRDPEAHGDGDQLDVPGEAVLDAEPEERLPQLGPRDSWRRTACRRRPVPG